MFRKASDFLVGLFLFLAVVVIIGAVVIAIAGNQTDGNAATLGAEVRGYGVIVLDFLKGLLGWGGPQK